LALNRLRSVSQRESAHGRDEKLSIAAFWISDDPPAITPAMLTNQGQAPTWWLQLSGEGKQMMLNQIPLSPTMP